MRRATVPAAALLACACSLWVKSDLRQCDLDDDCAHFAAGARCVAAVCVPPPDGGVLGPPGCFTGVPSTDLEFANACTTASFLAFDNCARAGLCDGGGPAPALVRPDAGPTAPGLPLDGGPTETCYDPARRPNVVFLNGSTNFTPFIRAMTPLLAESGFVIVWQPTSSCTGVDTVFNPDPARRVMRNPTTTAQSYASYYTVETLPNGVPCLLGGSPAAAALALPSGQEPVDLGQSDIFATSCPTTSAASPFDQYEPEQGAYAAVRHFLGPVQSMAFVVPFGSSQRVISAEAARLVFGLGGTARPVAPWTDPAYLWVRSATTGTNGIISRGIDVPPTAWWGVDLRSAPNLVSQLKTVSTGEAEKTIGTLSIDFADREKDNLHILYFQPRGALAGFLPDLKPFTRDKENVRDGHYPLWGPIHLYARQQAGDLTAGARAFVSQFSVVHPDQKLLDATIDTGNVPTCAMKVSRDTEMGPLHPFESSFQCHCYYEKKLNGGTGCAACTGPAECPAERPACNLGYCERQ